MMAVAMSQASVSDDHECNHEIFSSVFFLTVAKIYHFSNKNKYSLYNPSEFTHSLVQRMLLMTFFL